MVLKFCFNCESKLVPRPTHSPT